MNLGSLALIVGDYISDLVGLEQSKLESLITN